MITLLFLKAAVVVIWAAAIVILALLLEFRRSRTELREKFSIYRSEVNRRLRIFDNAIARHEESLQEIDVNAAKQGSTRAR